MPYRRTLQDPPRPLTRVRVPLAAAIALVVLASALPVASAAAPQMRADPFRAEVAAGSQFRGFLTITNPNDYAQDYALTVNAQQLTVFLDAPTAAVEPSATKKVGFLVIVPNAYAAREVLLRFDASDSGVSAQAFVIVNVTAQAPRYDAGILPATGESGIGASIDDGNTVDGQVHVTNQNSTTQTIPIRVRSDVEGWTYTLSAESLLLDPGKTDTVFVRFSPGPTAKNGSAFLEIGGGPSAHTSVVVSLNITHRNASAIEGKAQLQLSTRIEHLELDFASETYVQLYVRNVGTAPFDGPVVASVPASQTSFSIAGPTSVRVAPGDEVELAFRVSTSLDAKPDERSYITWRIGDQTGGLPLRIVTHLRIGGDRLDAIVPDGEVGWVNITVWNDGERPWTGEIQLDMPFGVAVSGNGEITVPEGQASVTRQFGIARSVNRLEPVQGAVVFRVPGGEWTVEIDVDGPRGALAIALDPGALVLAAGQAGLVNVRVQNLGDEPWSGLLAHVASPGLDAGATATPLTLDAHAEATVPVYVTLVSGETGEVEFTAGAARAVLPINPHAVAPRDEPATGEASLALVAIPVAAVAVGAGALAIAPRRWPLAFAGLYARLARSRLLEHPTRARIRELVEGEPGLTHNEIGRRLELERGTLEHHLAKLVKNGLLVAVPDGQLRRHYAPGSAQPATRAALDARILTHVRARGAPTPASEVASALGVSRQAMHYHLRRMVREGSVVAQRGSGGLMLRVP